MLGVKLPGDVLYGHYNDQRTRQSVLLQTLPISTSSASLVLQRINPRTSKQKASRSKVSIGESIP